MTPTVLFGVLTSKGIKPADATVLEAEYAETPFFADGLEIIAAWLGLKQTPTAACPACEPWQTIHTRLAQAEGEGTDLETAFSESIASLPSSVQTALTRAIAVRMKAIIDFETKKNNRKRFTGDDFINQLKQFGYSFDYNEITDTVEVSGMPLNDALAATIRMQLRDAGMTQTREAEDAYLSYAWHNRYHPIKNYLNSLVWNGEPNIEKLASYFTDEYDMFPIWLRKWMIGSCAKVFMTVKRPVQVPMLILDGKQNLGKSQFAKWLSSSVMEYFYEGAINPDNNDCIIRSASKWIWEVSELGATTRKSDQEALKAFLTYETVKARRPYGRFDVEKLSLATYIGTVNNYSGLFSDPTGNRRYLISKLLSIDWGYVTHCQVDQVWAEAMAAYQMGESWHPNSKERERSQEINTYYDVEDPVEDLIKKYFEIDPANQSWWTSTIDIIYTLENQGNVRMTSRLLSLSISATMAKMGLKKGMKRTSSGAVLRGYFGIVPSIYVHNP